MHGHLNVQLGHYIYHIGPLAQGSLKSWAVGLQVQVLLYNLAISHSVCLCVKPLFELGPDIDLQILTYRIFALFLGLMHVMCVYAY